jgi:hypothetical protein
LSFFHTDADLPPTLHARACGCALHSRRRWAMVLGSGAVAGGWLPSAARAQQDAGVVRGDVGKSSGFARIVPAEQVEQAAAAQYQQMQREAARQRALAPADHPQVVRLQAIADRIIPYTLPWNARARGWRWEVSLIGSKELNAFCMPGGKIAFFYGLLQRLQLSDAEVAAIMGHEMAHALREHARERRICRRAISLGFGQTLEWLPFRLRNSPELRGRCVFCPRGSVGHRTRRRHPRAGWRVRSRSVGQRLDSVPADHF